MRINWAMPKPVFLVLAMFSCLLGPRAESSEGRYIVWGHGNDSCGTFIQENQNRTNAFEREISWVAGFVTAGNGEWILVSRKQGITLDVDFLRGLDNAALEAWLIQFCKENPLKNLVSAGTALQTALIKKVTKDMGTQK